MNTSIQIVSNEIVRNEDQKGDNGGIEDNRGKDVEHRVDVLSKVYSNRNKKNINSANTIDAINGLERA